MTKSTITRERIQRIIRAINSEAYDEEEIREWLSSDEIMELSRMALAAMDGEPDCNERNLFCSTDTARMRKVISVSAGIEGAPLYRHAQPAPVVPELRVDWQENEFSAGWNACRAAMLQAGTLTNEGTKQAWTGIPDIDNAINMLDRIDTLESCDDDRIEAVKTVLRRLAGNSPVIPDGYVVVPKEPTKAMILSAMRDNETGEVAEIYDLMLAAAPHDTPALNSLQSVDSVAGKWIPVSERMPEDRISVILWDAEIGEVTSGHYSHKTQTFYHCGDAIENEITHWMPPPCAPQEVNRE